MNCDKAQELFSEFHEETLAEGLRLNVNRHFENCASCAADFTSFQRAYRSITEVNPPTAPDDLGEMIARRLDRVDFERKRSSARPLSWVRIGASAAAVAAVLTVALVYKPNSPRGAGASILPPIAEQCSRAPVLPCWSNRPSAFLARR
jgi:hypothetical protein